MLSFDDFMNSLDPDEFAAEIECICKHEVIQWDEESFPTLMEYLHNRCTSDSVKIALLYLRKYHEWLEQQL